MSTSLPHTPEQPDAGASAHRQGPASSPEQLIAPRGELFADPTARAIWAAITALDVGAQHLVLEELERRLRADEPAATHDSRERRAIDALREAGRLNGGSPSVERYRELRLADPDRERGWPTDGSIRRWLGGGWNSALSRARLEPLTDGDTVVRQLGPAFSLDEITTALRECAKELAYVPAINEYYGWARRPDVKRRDGRRPQSQPPFDRHGGYIACLRAAGLVADDTIAGVPASALVRVGNYFVDDQTIVEALKEIATRIGCSPRTMRYKAERELIHAEAQANGQLRSLPSLATIQKRFGSWDAALVAAGLEPLGGRARGGGGAPKGRKAPRVTDDAIRSAIREAFAKLGHPFTSEGFKRWRVEQEKRDRAMGVFRRLPSYHTIWTRYGSWQEAVCDALDPSMSAADGTGETNADPGST